MTQLQAIGPWALLLLAPLLAGCPALAGEVTASSGSLGLGTALNGVVGGSCGAGLCQVSGGTAAGSNLFHRFSAFDTRGAITGVNVNTGGIPNVFMAVLNPAGTFIDKSVNFSGPTNLVWLSPGGIVASGGGRFANVPQFRLSSASGWRVGSGVFDAAGTTAGQASLLTGTPPPGLAGAVNDPSSLAGLGLQSNGALVLSGGLLTVDPQLMADPQGDNLLLQATGIEPSPRGPVTLGRQFDVLGLSGSISLGPAPAQPSAQPALVGVEQAINPIPPWMIDAAAGPQLGESTNPGGATDDSQPLSAEPFTAAFSEPEPGAMEAAAPGPTPSEGINPGGPNPGALPAPQPRSP
ncbi:MAG: hypothetical protein ACKO8I_03850, partial [Cyanobacteriota bacterium]